MREWWQEGSGRMRVWRKTLSSVFYHIFTWYRHCWLADVAFFLLLTSKAAFQHSKHFWSRFPSSCGQKGLDSRLVRDCTLNHECLSSPVADGFLPKRLPSTVPPGGSKSHWFLESYCHMLETSYDHSLAFPSSSFDHLQYAKMERKTRKDDVMCKNIR